MRLFKKLAVYIIPFLILFLLFFAFEPYDYFAIKGDAAYSSRPLSSMREFLKEKPSQVVFGDSQMANLNIDYVNEITGEDYYSLAFGGASLHESADLFWFAAENAELERVIFGVSFYSLGRYSDESRIPIVLEQVNNPFKFVSRFNYWLEAFNVAKYRTMNLAADAFDKPAWKWYPEDPTQFDTPAPPEDRGDVYRKNLEEYAEIIKGQLGVNYEIKDEAYGELQKIIDYCDENGIELIFVFPPVQESIFTNVIEPLGIEDEIGEAKAFLIERATVYDFQTVNSFTTDESNFYDGFHLWGENKREFADMLFLGTDSDALRVYEK